MTVYNLNLGIGWASSGVEYAQSYRANMFRRKNIPAKFIFTDMFVTDYIQRMTANIGFKDEEVIWLYSYFTDFKIAPPSFTPAMFEKTFPSKNFTKEENGKSIRYTFPNSDLYFVAYLFEENGKLIHRVEYVSKGFLIRKDYFSYARMMTEYYAPKDNQAVVYSRSYYNEDGSVAYEEIVDEKKSMFIMKDKILYSKEEFIAYFIKSLKLTKKDIFIIDRSTGTAQEVFENCNDARIGCVIHADHFSESCSFKRAILWNNYYEYMFANTDKIDFFITATDAQNELLKEQFKKYKGVEPEIVTIPVGSVDELIRPTAPRKKHSLMTASRLAPEKHADWIVRAVAKAREKVPDISLDIYGYGPEQEKIEKAIEENNAASYIRLMGHADLHDVYKNYETYVSGSTSEGFGLTLLEAVGSGLSMVGFDVRYGNKTFIKHGVNGYLVPKDKDSKSQDLINQMAEALVKLETASDLEKMSEESYKIAEGYLTETLEKRWKDLVSRK